MLHTFVISFSLVEYSAFLYIIAERKSIYSNFAQTSNFEIFGLLQILPLKLLVISALSSCYTQSWLGDDYELTIIYHQKCVSLWGHFLSEFFMAKHTKPSPGLSENLQWRFLETPKIGQNCFKKQTLGGRLVSAVRKILKKLQ